MSKNIEKYPYDISMDQVRRDRIITLTISRLPIIYEYRTLKKSKSLNDIYHLLSCNKKTI